MKSINLLLLSSTITLVSIMLIQPVIAQPMMAVHHFASNHAKISSSKQELPFTAQFSSLPDNPANRMLNNYTNIVDDKISDRLVLSNFRRTAEQLSKRQLNNLNNNNTFFDSAMVFNDKMQQFISYFTNNNAIQSKGTHTSQGSHQTDEEMAVNKCGS